MSLLPRKDQFGEKSEKEIAIFVIFVSTFLRFKKAISYHLSRTLMGDPDLIMIDEPTEGLAPQIVQRIAETFLEIKKRGVSILLVEQKLTIALDISDIILVMGRGTIVFKGTVDDFKNNTSIRREWLELT
jgi:ABC-type branched-subunit amino acid transport system ATPase component